MYVSVCRPTSSHNMSTSHIGNKLLAKVGLQLHDCAIKCIRGFSQLRVYKSSRSACP